MPIKVRSWWSVTTSGSWRRSACSGPCGYRRVGWLRSSRCCSLIWIDGFSGPTATLSTVNLMLMAIEPDTSPYGGQTVSGPGWPNVDEEMLAATAAKFEALAAKISGSVVPQQQGQLMKLTDVWEGTGSMAAAGEATTIIGGHEANAAHATAIAVKLRAMEASVV